MGFVFLGEQFSLLLQKCIRRREGVWERAGLELADMADKVMGKGPWSVTAYGAVAPSRDPHDYFSEAPYWWPDPAQPGGPYIRKDGVTRPDRFMGHRQSFEDLADAVLTLCQAGYLLEERRYLERAAELLRVWFLRPESRMNPRVEYGEAIPGLVNGRPAGIIVLRHLDRIVHALGFLDSSGEWKEDAVRMRDWLADLLIWLTTSPLALKESRSGNNHAMWWATHVAAVAAYLDDEEKLQLAFDHFRNVIVPEQLAVDGSLPKELARTRSLHYTLFHLDSAAMLCELAHGRGLDLWHYQTQDGRGMRAAISFVLPFLDHPASWRWPNIDQELPGERLALQLASIRLGMEEGARVNAKRRGDDPTRLSGENVLGPLYLLPGHPYQQSTQA